MAAVVSGLWGRPILTHFSLGRRQDSFHVALGTHTLPRQTSHRQGEKKLNIVLSYCLLTLYSTASFFHN